MLARLLLRLPLRLAGRAPLPCPTRRGLLAVPAPLPLALLHHAQRLVMAHQVLAHAQLLASPCLHSLLQASCPMSCARWW